MPVVIDYDPAGAIGQLANQVGLNRNFAESESLGAQQAHLQMAQQEAAAREQEMERQTELQQQRIAGNTQPQQYAGAPQQLATHFTDPYGRTYQGVSPMQRAQLQNLSNFAGNQDDYDSGARKILGVPAEQQQYTDLTGKTYTLAPKDAASRSQKDFQIKQQAQQFGQKMQAQSGHWQDMDQQLAAKAQRSMDKDFDGAEAKQLANGIAQAKANLDNAQKQYAANPYAPDAGDKLKKAMDAVDAAYDSANTTLDAKVKARNALAPKVAGKTLEEVRAMGGDQEALLTEYFRQLTAKNRDAAAAGTSGSGSAQAKTVSFAGKQFTDNGDGTVTSPEGGVYKVQDGKIVSRVK